jgi:hypothetical protein
MSDAPQTSKPLLARTPTAEEYALLRQAYDARGVLVLAQKAEIERLRAALERAEEGLQCGGHRDRDHYCPNCDNSLWPVRKGLQDARDGAAGEQK